MSHKRYKDQILLNIMQVCGGGTSKTQIVYKSGLNFRTVVPYLDLLTNRGLVVRAEGQKLHKRRRMGWQRETMSCERL